jgi:hypothetical protein
MELKIAMLLGFALELVAIGAVVMCAIYLREIAAVLKRRGD